ESLSLGGFNVTGLSTITNFTGVNGTGATVVSPEVSYSGVSTAAAAIGATAAASFQLHGYGTVNATTGAYANYAVEDASGNLYAVDAADVDAATGVVDLSNALADAATAATSKADYDADATAGITATANPLAKLDKALQ